MNCYKIAVFLSFVAMHSYAPYIVLFICFQQRPFRNQVVQVYDLILMLNFFRQVPGELEDAALIDGASHFRTMLNIYVPVSMPAIATMTLFCMVYHWNQWFDGMLYMDNVNLRPLQTFLRQTLIGQDYTFADGDEIAAFAEINDRSLRCAQIIIATIPILCSYPFLQRYFVKGIIVGSVKG